MAILDLQGLEAPAERGGHGGGGVSTLSLLSCVSAASVVLCV
jgi:lanthionine-containing peptide SapB